MAISSPQGQPGECTPATEELRRRDANCAFQERPGRKGKGKEKLGWGSHRGEEKILQGERVSDV